MTEGNGYARRQPHIFVAVPAYGGTVITELMMSCITLAQALPQHGIAHKFGTLSFPDIVEVRNIFLTIWYDKCPESTHLLFVDSDMNFTPQLVLDLLNSEYPVVGIIPVKKKLPIEFVGRAEENQGDPVNGFLKVGGVGAGVLMIAREAISEMLMKMPDIVDPYPLHLHPATELILGQGLTRLLRPFDPIVNMEIGRLSEDLSFSQRWIRCGGEVWANISHAVGHIGKHEFRASYADFLEQKKKAAEAAIAAGQAPPESIVVQP